MAAINPKENRLNERTGWTHLWIGSQWKRYFLVLTPEAMQIFSSDQRNKIKRTLNLEGCHSEIKELFLSEKQDHLLFQKASKERSSSSLRLWKNMSKLAVADHDFPSADAAIIIIEPQKGKKCCLLFQSQKEAECWKVGIEEATALAASNSPTKSSKRPPKGCTRSNEDLDTGHSKRVITKASSLLKRPFGLRWEPHPHLHMDRNKDGIADGKLKKNLMGGVASEEVKAVEETLLEPLWHDLETFQGCTEFLRSSCLNVNALGHATLMIDHFKGSYQMGDSSLSDELRLEAWKGTMRRIVKTFVEQLLANNPALDSCLVNEEHMDQLWMACEVWVSGAVHDKIMGACKQMCAVNDSLLDQTLAKLQKVDPATLGVRAEFNDFILGEAFQQFRMLNRFRTPFEKALCLRRTVCCIVDGIQSLIKSCTGALRDTEGLLPSTDDLLSFMLLLMAQGKVKNLQANACYMENFLSLHKENRDQGELIYHITNFVAACNYLQSAEIQDMVANVPLPPSTPTKMISPSSQFQNVINESSPSFQYSFSFPGNTAGDSNKLPLNPISAAKRSYSLESYTKSKYREESNLENHSDKGSCFDNNAFNNWKINNSMMPGVCKVENSDCSGCARNWTADLFTSETGDELFSVASWVDGDNFRGSPELPNLPGLFYQREFLAFPGESPEFILASTYQ